jgi:hypothetical protein
VFHLLRNEVVQEVAVHFLDGIRAQIFSLGSSVRFWPGSSQSLVAEGFLLQPLLDLRDR